MHNRVNVLVEICINIFEYSMNKQVNYLLYLRIYTYILHFSMYS